MLLSVVECDQNDSSVFRDLLLEPVPLLALSVSEADSPRTALESGLLDFAVVVVGCYAFGSHSCPDVIENLCAELEVLPVHYIFDRGIRLRLKQFLSLITHGPGGFKLVDLLSQAIARMVPDNLHLFQELVDALVNFPKLMRFLVEPIIESGLDIKNRILHMLEFLKLLL